MYYVKTVYGPKSNRLPYIAKYETNKEAEMFILTCSKWGMDVIACERINEAVAKHMLLRGEAEE